MIVLGADTHKQSHTVGAVEPAGRLVASKTFKAKRRSLDDLLIWARGLDGERVWAIEDCRHVSRALERSCSSMESRSCVSRRSFPQSAAWVACRSARNRRVRRRRTAELREARFALGLVEQLPACRRPCPSRHPICSATSPPYGWTIQPRW
jgi:hypothetical protein